MHKKKLAASIPNDGVGWIDSVESAGETLESILKKKLELVSDILELEVKKRKAVLGARGGDLRVLIHVSEQLSQRLASLDRNFVEILRLVSAKMGVGNEQELSLERKMALVFSEGNYEERRVSGILENYKAKLLELREAIRENEQVLKQANRNVGDALHDLQSKKQTVTYKHKTFRSLDDRKNSQLSGLGGLCNENA